MANTGIVDIQADFTPFTELLDQTLGVAEKPIRRREMTENEGKRRVSDERNALSTALSSQQWCRAAGFPS